MNFPVYKIALGGFLLLIVCCQLSCHSAHSAANYRNQDVSQLYAIICHHNKHTQRVKAEDWPEHKSHGDYRGPCRARGLADPPAKGSAQTSTTYKGASARKAQSQAEWDRIEEAKASLKVNTDEEGLRR